MRVRIASPLPLRNCIQLRFLFLFLPAHATLARYSRSALLCDAIDSVTIATSYCTIIKTFFKAKNLYYENFSLFPKIVLRSVTSPTSHCLSPFDRTMLRSMFLTANFQPSPVAIPYDGSVFMKSAVFLSLKFCRRRNSILKSAIYTCFA